MKRPDPQYAPHQQGMATLLITLVLMMAVTVVTLSVARTQIAKQKIANNDNWRLRLSLQAEATLARAIDLLNTDFYRLPWAPGPDGELRVHHNFPTDPDTGMHTKVSFVRARESEEFVSIQATAMHSDRSGLQAQITELVRPLSVLTPLAEAAPPLIVNGCLFAAPSGFHVRPFDADSDQASDAVWIKRDADCEPMPGIDTHGGRAIERHFDNDLWPTIFSVDRETYASLVASQDPVAGRQSIYMSAHGLAHARWTKSVGSPTRHVVPHFPAASGCPAFAPGVRIYGVVFIDAACNDPLTSGGLEVYGSLIVNGNLNVLDAKLQLNHIQAADSRQSRLSYPVLRTVPVPGSWRDF